MLFHIQIFFCFTLFMEFTEKFEYQIVLFFKRFLMSFLIPGRFFCLLQDKICGIFDGKSLKYCCELATINKFNATV